MQHVLNTMSLEIGLKRCVVCDAEGRKLPTDCPGHLMTVPEKDRVYAGEIDFKDGKWLAFPVARKRDEW